MTPRVDAGRFPAKRALGDILTVGARVLKEGHDLLRARIHFRGPGDSEPKHAAMEYDSASDRWTGTVSLDRVGRWTFGVEAWTDTFGSWRDGFEKKVAAGVDVSVELLEGALLVRDAARHAKRGDDYAALRGFAATLKRANTAVALRSRDALSARLQELMESHAPPGDLTTSEPELAVVVDRKLARFAAWYEMFPRSQTSTETQHGTFADAENRLPALAALGFDVVYLPPIHPIGQAFRKGKNNSLEPEPGDVGSPWAIGSDSGGHTAVDPNLGTLEDFDRFVSRANELGLEVALDYALQCSPDHPWVTEHPEWFVIRPDGSIQYAENPPKKYQDIYPLNFWCDDREALWQACLDILHFWIGHGVHTFRVDNPHTKPFAFWEWIITEVKAAHPDIIFLAEAFTRPSKLLYLAKLGFSQSYTYFTWKNTSAELHSWMTEFSEPDVLEYYRGNLFANTPDILHEYLQTGGLPAFRVRLLLATTLSPLYGIYSGFELGESAAVRPGSEEYLDSEKYQIRPRNYDATGNLNDDIRKLNDIRRAEPALQQADNLSFAVSDNPEILFYHKRSPNGAGDLLIAVNLDPLHVQEGTLTVPVASLGLSPDEQYVVEDLLTGTSYTWRGARNYVRLDPALHVGHLFRVVRSTTTSGVK